MMPIGKSFTYNKKNMNRIILSLVLLAAIWYGCRDNIDTTSIEPGIGPIPVVNVKSSLIGRVVDPAGSPIKDAKVEVAGQTYSTDSKGFFFVKNKLLNKNGTKINAQKAAYFESVRFAYPTLGNTARVEIQMIPKNLSGTLTSSSGGTINVGNNASVSIPA